jgi:hypothetical protein
MRLYDIGSLIAYLYQSNINYYSFEFDSSTEFQPYLFEAKHIEGTTIILSRYQTDLQSYDSTMKHIINSYKQLYQPIEAQFSSFKSLYHRTQELSDYYQAPISFQENTRKAYSIKSQTLPHKLNTDSKLGATVSTNFFSYTIIVGPIEFKHYLKIRCDTAYDIRYLIKFHSIPLPALNTSHLSQCLLINGRQNIYSIGSP